MKTETVKSSPMKELGWLFLKEKRINRELLEACKEADKAIQKWRKTGKTSIADFLEVHENIISAILKAEGRAS